MAFRARSEVIDIAWSAQRRLRHRYERMCARGKPQIVTIVALARGLPGFLWSIGQRVEAATSA